MYFFFLLLISLPLIIQLKFPVLPVSCPIPDFYARILCYLGFYAGYCAWCEVGVGVGPYVARRCPKTRTWFYPGVQFNLSARFPILDPSPAPVPAGNWGAELRGSSASRTLQRRSKCVCLPTPVIEKGILPFSLTWIESIDREQLGLTSLAFLPLKEQTAKNVSVGVTVLVVLVFLDPFPPVQERCHWVVLVCIRVSVTKIDVNDGVDPTIQ